MKNKLLFTVAIVGFLAGMIAAHLFAMKKPPLPPAFKPAENPYSNGIYSEGIIESAQTSGSNINVFPEITGVIKSIRVTEGQKVERGTTLVLLDDSVPKAQAEAAQSNLKSAEDTFSKEEATNRMASGAISQDVLDTARNAVATARFNFEAANALLSKYTIKANAPGIVMALNVTQGGTISPQGIYNPYTQGYDPILTLGTPQANMNVRCYVDEILVTKLPQPSEIHAQMAIRGSDIRIPLAFVRMQPFVSPKIELSDQRTERVDIRVLPVVFSFVKPSNINLFPGELVDVYIGASTN